MFTLPIKAYKIKEQNQMRNMLKIIVRSGPGPEPLRKKLQRVSEKIVSFKICFLSTHDLNRNARINCINTFLGVKQEITISQLLRRELIFPLYFYLKYLISLTTKLSAVCIQLVLPPHYLINWKSFEVLHSEP